MSLESLYDHDAKDWTLAYYQKWIKETKPINPKGNHPWIFIGRTDAEVENPTLWPPDAKSRLIGKDSDSGKDWRQEEKGATKDKMVRWHHWLNGHEFDQTLGGSEGQGSIVCYSPWGLKESDMSEWLSNKLPWAQTQFWGGEPVVYPFAWQSNKTIVFYFKRNQDLIWHQCTEAELLKSF